MTPEMLERADELTRKLTIFQDFEALLRADSYRYSDEWHGSFYTSSIVKKKW